MSATSRLKRWLGRHPVLKAAVKAVVAPLRGGASTAYRELDAGERARDEKRLEGAWQTAELPARQRALVDSQLAAYRNGEGNPAWDALIAILRPLATGTDGRPASVLEVGCSSGYHGEVFQIGKLDIAYEGCDYSPAFIRLAEQLYPATRFRVADATALPHGDASVDVLLSGCCLLHIARYEDAIRESARVARRHVIFHRTPVLHTAPTTAYRKRAYGVETVELHFNEAELVGLFAKHGLRVIGVVTLDVAWKAGDALATKEYVCEKVTANAEATHAG